MQAILKSKHQRFIDWIKDVRSKQSSADNDLDRMETRLQVQYHGYEQKMYELKKIIDEYEEQKRLIQNEVKRIKKAGLLEDRITNSFHVKTMMSSNSLDL